ncbi:ABC transporter permease [Paenibacillus sp. 481]|uniref:ABC transporter permease n=1 Tax=Paenibacillus sp. 481 TaxID=2835869 RepID=UPI001E5B03F8|nr:ABC transporter permease [Paenibacillus sp. 481]UHA71766.1 ABC transporter permease [Paenibacillus sp. 481]
MVNLLYTELLKLKRAKMFMVSIIGASAAPILMFVAFLTAENEKPSEQPITFEVSFYNTNLYVLLLIGTLLYGVITAYLFNREYVEDTLKNLLTIPVSRTSLIASKMAMLFIWIVILTLVAWGMTLILGLIGQFDGLSVAVLMKSLQQHLVGAVLLFLLSTPTIFVTFLFKNYVPTIIFTSVITMANIAITNSKYKVLFPWSAAHAIANNEFNAHFPPLYSYISVLVTAAIGLIATVVYFKKSDIH